MPALSGRRNAVAARSIEPFARGVESGQAAARASLELTLQEQKRQYETRLAAEGQAREEEAAKFAAALTAGLVSVERIIGDAVGGCCDRFLPRGLSPSARRAARDLGRAAVEGAGDHA